MKRGSFETEATVFPWGAGRFPRRLKCFRIGFKENNKMEMDFSCFFRCFGTTCIVLKEKCEIFLVGGFASKKLEEKHLTSEADLGPGVFLVFAA